MRLATITKRTLILLSLLVPLLAGADMLDLYSRLSGKTILMPSALPRLPDAIASDIIPAALPEQTNIITRIENELARNGIAVVQDGPHFVRFLPEKQVDYFLTNAPLRGAELSPSLDSKTNAAPRAVDQPLPSGSLGFRADLYQVLEIYSLLTDRTILRPAVLPTTVLRLKTVGDLTMSEGIYALETVLALNGISVIDDGEKFVQVVPTTERGRVTTRAPKPEPGAKPDRSIDLRGANVNQVLEFYATLRGRTISGQTNLPSTTMGFRTQGELTSTECVYAIETVLALNGISVVDDGEKFVRVMPLRRSP